MKWETRNQLGVALCILKPKSFPNTVTVVPVLHYHLTPWDGRMWSYITGGLLRKGQTKRSNKLN